MGPRYVIFRLWFEFRKRIGYLEKQFPTKHNDKVLISLEAWKHPSSKFFFDSKDSLIFKHLPTASLEKKANEILSGKFTFFSSIPVDVDFSDQQKWHRNYENGVLFPQIHWVKIQDFSAEFGDIKFVWELSRFSFLNTIVRYDYHFEKDQSAFVFNLIEDWIDSNPMNIGPNYKCSQEISIRLFNWIFALNYYKSSPNLTPALFNKIINSINNQYQHVYKNINFSRIAVRNNHAISETLCLFIVGSLFPFLDNAKEYAKKGKKWFEEEIDYQIYDDGTYLQFSMNYHRVVVQLLTWAIALSKKNNWTLDSKVEEKASKSLEFLMVCMCKETGHLPNYGANDGALFFPLNESEYRDYRAQLNALSFAINGNALYNSNNVLEDIMWYFNCLDIPTVEIDTSGIHKFEKGGYYIYNDPLDNTKTFIRCGNHKDRPSHADNLHLDIWVGSENIVRDCGSYKYNTDSKYLNFFTGTASHNTVMLGEYNQMQKGNRFIWLNWTQSVFATFTENESEIKFEGEIKAFSFLGKNIRHKRVWTKDKGKKLWKIEDYVMHKSNLNVNQNWNISSNFLTNYELDIVNFGVNNIRLTKNNSWYSELYGKKEDGIRLQVSSSNSFIETIIKSL